MDPGEETKTSDIEPLLQAQRERVPADYDSRAAINDRERGEQISRAPAEGEKSTLKPLASRIPATAGDGENLKAQIATSLQQARQLLRKVKHQEPEPDAGSQGDGAAAPRGRTEDRLLRYERQALRAGARQPASSSQRPAAGVLPVQYSCEVGTPSTQLPAAIQYRAQIRRGEPRSYGSIEPPPPSYETSRQGVQYQPHQATRAHLSVNPTVQQPRAESWYRPGIFGPDFNITQPEAGRAVISGTVSTNSLVSYTYADDLPCRFYSYIMMAVILVVITTPLSLFCTVPAIYMVNKACEEAEQGDLAKARDTYQVAKVYMYIAVFLNAIISLIIGGIVLGVKLGASSY